MEKDKSKEILQIMLDRIQGKQISPADQERLEAVDAALSMLDGCRPPNSKKLVITFGDSSVFTHSDQAVILMAVIRLLVDDLHLVVDKASFVEDNEKS